MAFKSRLKCLFLKPIFCILFATFLHFARNTTFEQNHDDKDEIFYKTYSFAKNLNKEYPDLEKEQKKISR